MFKNYTITTFFCVFTFSIFSQNLNLETFLISEELKKDANSIIRFENYHMDMVSQNDMTINLKTAITIFNKRGDDYADITLSYDRRRTIKSVKAYYYDAFGKEIEKVKKKDFKD